MIFYKGSKEERMTFDDRHQEAMVALKGLAKPIRDENTRRNNRRWIESIPIRKESLQLWFL